MKAIRIAAIFLIAALTILLLTTAKSLLLPLVSAICVWFIVNTIASGIQRIKIGGRNIPHNVAILVSSLLILGIIFFAIEVIVSSAESLMMNAQKYQSHLDGLIERIKTQLELDELPSFASIVHDIELKDSASAIGLGLSNAASQVLFVLIYTIFMLAEQGSFSKKLLALSRNRRHHQNLRKTFIHINSSVKTYITIKTGICVGQALFCFVVMWLIGLEFAVFWAFMIFLLNYIPTFGSMIGTILPSLFAILQFDSLGTVALLAVLIWAIQFFMANFLEPKLMGNTLNISTLVVLLSLSLWGAIWGIAGMIFSVPITVIIIIICAEFPSSRPIAIILSADGDINSPKEVPGLIGTASGEPTRLEPPIIEAKLS